MRLIDANELKEWVENWLETNKYYHPYSKSNNIPINELYDILEHMPTVDAERHGHWEKIETTKVYDCQNTLPIYKCSFCHTPFVNVDLKDRYHYCPHCGAKMDNTIINNINDDIKTSDDKIIRCKDCKQWDAELECCTSYTIVKCTDGREGVSSDSDDFCSRGRRKDENLR